MNCQVMDVLEIKKAFVLGTAKEDGSQSEWLSLDPTRSRALSMGKFNGRAASHYSPKSTSCTN